MNTELARLIAGHVFLHGSMAGLRVAAPLLALTQGHRAFAVGALFALFGLAQVFLAIPAGRLADRRGLKYPVGLAVVTASLATALPAIWPTYVALCAAALVSGCAVGTAIVALQRHVGRAASGDPTQLKQVFSWLGLGPAISNFVGPMAAGLLIDHGGVLLGASPTGAGAVAAAGHAGTAWLDFPGYRVAFCALALSPLVTWACVRKTVELPPAVMPPGHQAKPALDLLRDAQFRRLLLCNWALSACWDVHSFMVPVIGHEHGFSASTIGAIVGGFAAAATVVRLVVPLLAERLTEWVVIVTVMLGAALLLGLYPMLVHPWAMGAGSVMLGFVLGAVQPMMLSTLHQITPEHRHGEALGLRMAMTNLCSVVMPLAFGAAGAAVGAKVVFWGVAGLTGLSSRLAWGLKIKPSK